jgi:hypothetical protein
MTMFGVSDDLLVRSLETLRRGLCAYGPTAVTCDCKFLDIPPDKPRNNEQTGCCEIRQAIRIITDQRESVLLTERLMDESAANTLAQIRRILDG